MITQVTPILRVDDLEEAVWFYQRLGFDIQRYDPTYAFALAAGREVLHLQVQGEIDLPAIGCSVYLHVTDVDGVHEEWAAAGVAVGGLVSRPWGMREFSLRDPAGNTLRVGTNV